MPKILVVVDVFAKNDRAKAKQQPDKSETLEQERWPDQEQNDLDGVASKPCESLVVSFKQTQQHDACESIRNKHKRQGQADQPPRGMRRTHGFKQGQEATKPQYTLPAFNSLRHGAFLCARVDRLLGTFSVRFDQPEAGSPRTRSKGAVWGYSGVLLFVQEGYAERPKGFGQYSFFATILFR